MKGAEAYSSGGRKKESCCTEIQVKRWNKQLIPLTVLETKLGREKQQNDAGEREEPWEKKKRKEREATAG